MPEAKTFKSFYETAAMIFHTEKWPDEFILVSGDSPSRSQVLFRYNDASELPIKDLEARQLDVEPLGYSEIIFKLKRQAFDIIDAHFKKENTDVTDTKDETV